MRSIGVGRRDRSRETVIGHNLCNGCRHAAGIPIAAIVSVGRFLPPSDRNKRVAGPGFIDLHRLEFRRSAYRVELRRLYHGQTLRHGVHIEIEILHAGRLAVGVVSLFGDSQHGIDGAVGGNDRKSVVVLKIENIHQSVAPGAAARGRGSDALAAFAADRTGSGRAGCSGATADDSSSIFAHETTQIKARATNTEVLACFIVLVFSMASSFNQLAHMLFAQSDLAENNRKRPSCGDTVTYEYR